MATIFQRREEGVWVEAIHEQHILTAKLDLGADVCRVFGLDSVV
jgi:hypothetical protein